MSRFNRVSEQIRLSLDHRDLLAGAGAARSGHDEEVEHALLRERGGIQAAARTLGEMAR